MKNYLLCCDWGTSSFRLRLINILDFQLIGEVFSPDGIAVTFNAWKENLSEGNIGRNRFFCEYLKSQIDILSDQMSFNLDGIGIVISGMASSSIGMEEIPYSDLPSSTDGNQMDIRIFAAHDDFQHEIILISGVKSDTDVMRGEETQLVGLLNLEELSFLKNEDGIYIFPGTHSKHMYVKENKLVNFQTFMTGEVFMLMTSYSILKDSVDSEKEGNLTNTEIDAFKKGVSQAGSSNLLNSLFKVRTNQLFETMSKSENALYLSGLLIGNELKHLKEGKMCKLILCSGNNLYELYKLALEELGFSARTTTISADMVNKATIAGQIKIYQNQMLKLTNTNL